MIKKHKFKLILSSLLILLPAILGFVFRKAIHDHTILLGGLAGANDLQIFTGVSLTVPFIFLALHWLCVLATFYDNKKNGQSEKILHITLWICPVISLFVGALTLAFSLGWKINVCAITGILFSILMIVIGNYMPKCRQNRTIGFKCYWTLASEENWNATHRFGGKILVAAGLLMLPCIFLPMVAFLIVFFSLVLLMVFAPLFYSYRYYKRKLERGEIEKISYRPQKQSKIAIIVSTVLLVPILAFCAIIMFTGDFNVIQGETELTVEATFYGDIAVNYADITAIEYIENGEVAHRLYGFGSPKLSMGQFETKSLGQHTRYTYEGCDAEIVLTVGSNKLVLNRQTPEETLDLYQALLEKTAK